MGVNATGLLALHLAGDVVQVFSSLVTTRLAENYARPLFTMPEDASEEDKLQFETFKNFIASWVACVCICCFLFVVTFVFFVVFCLCSLFLFSVVRLRPLLLCFSLELCVPFDCQLKRQLAFSCHSIAQLNRQLAFSCHSIAQLKRLLVCVS
jgi:flagellar biosynthesis protein FlhB